MCDGGGRADGGASARPPLTGRTVGNWRRAPPAPLPPTAPGVGGICRRVRSSLHRRRFWSSRGDARHRRPPVGRVIIIRHRPRCGLPKKLRPVIVSAKAPPPLRYDYNGRILRPPLPRCLCGLLGVAWCRSSRTGSGPQSSPPRCALASARCRSASRQRPVARSNGR